jgi:hypothetical protein
LDRFTALAWRRSLVLLGGFFQAVAKYDAPQVVQSIWTLSYAGLGLGWMGAAMKKRGNKALTFVLLTGSDQYWQPVSRPAVKRLWELGL